MFAAAVHDLLRPALDAGHILAPHTGELLNDAAGMLEN
jgi:hypothetical protein